MKHFMKLLFLVSIVFWALCPVIQAETETQSKDKNTETQKNTQSTSNHPMQVDSQKQDIGAIPGSEDDTNGQDNSDTKDSDKTNVKDVILDQI